MRRLRGAGLVMVTAAVAGAAIAAAACGGSGDNAAKQDEGAAASMTAQYFVQEAAGNKLPEGLDVAAIGAKTILPLPVTGDQKKQSVRARFCVEYQYRDKSRGFQNHTRVYIAQMMKEGWTVEAVKPDGDCSGVS